jgi:hypothetical protein
MIQMFIPNAYNLLSCVLKKLCCVFSSFFNDSLIFLIFKQNIFLALKSIEFHSLHARVSEANTRKIVHLSRVISFSRLSKIIRQIEFLDGVSYQKRTKNNTLQITGGASERASDAEGGAANRFCFRK